MVGDVMFLNKTLFCFPFFGINFILLFIFIVFVDILHHRMFQPPRKKRERRRKQSTESVKDSLYMTKMTRMMMSGGGGILFPSLIDKKSFGSSTRYNSSHDFRPNQTSEKSKEKR